MLLSLSDISGKARMGHARARVGLDTWPNCRSMSRRRHQVRRMMKECPPGGEVGHGACAPVGACVGLSDLSAAEVSGVLN